MIYINGRCLTQKITGVQRFGIEVIKELDRIVEKGEVEVVSPPGIINELELENINIVEVGKKSNNYWTQITFPRYVRKHKGVALTMAGLCPVIRPDYFVAHDVTFLRQPDSFSRNFRIVYKIAYKLSLSRCKKVFTVSRFSEDEICETIGVQHSQFVVVGSSSSHLVQDKFEEVDLGKWELSDKGYYLSVSSRNRHKNQQYILDLAEKHPDKLFVIVGSSGIKAFNSLEFKEKKNVIFTGYVTNDELYTLYKKAKGFIFPSLYEGFGLPPLEAITMGVERVAVSDIRVFREVYPRNVYYFNPNDVDSFDFDEFEKTFFTQQDRNLYLEEHNWKKITSTILEVIKENDK